MKKNTDWKRLKTKVDIIKLRWKYLNLSLHYFNSQY